MRINGRILIAIVAFVIVTAAGAVGLGKLGGIALIKELYAGNAAQQVTAAANQVTAAAHQVTVADVVKNVETLKHEATLSKMLDNYTELVDIRADGSSRRLCPSAHRRG
jgi:hypothetical protein